MVSELPYERFAEEPLWDAGIDIRMDLRIAFLERCKNCARPGSVPETVGCDEAGDMQAQGKWPFSRARYISISDLGRLAADNSTSVFSISFS